MMRLRAAETEWLRRPGAGPALILLHGIGSDAQSWSQVMAALPDDVDALAWWAPGYGDSAPVERAHPQAYAARLAAALDALALPRAVIIGHSLGALFAGAFAAAFPERLAGLALLSPALGYRVPEGAALPDKVQARIDDLAALGPAAFAAARAHRLLHAPEEKPQLLGEAQRAMAAVRLPGYTQAVQALAAGDLLADAAHIMQPALVMCGAEDATTPPANARALHAALPAGGTLRLFEGCGHALPLEAPRAIAEAIAEWLAHA